MKKFLFLTLFFMSSLITAAFNPPRMPHHVKVLKVDMEGCSIPVNQPQMHAVFNVIALLVSSRSTEEEEIIMLHTFKKDGLSSAYSLPDANIYIRNWPKRHMANIKITYFKSVSSLEILDLLGALFSPENLRIVCMPNE